MVFEVSFASSALLQKRDSDLWTVNPPRNQNQLDPVPVVVAEMADPVPGSGAEVAVPIPEDDDIFIVDCNDMEIISDSSRSPSPEALAVVGSVNAGFLAPMADEGIFMTESSGKLPPRHYNTSSSDVESGGGLRDGDRSLSTSRTSFSNLSTVGLAVGGGRDDKDDSTSVGDSSIVGNPCFVGGSRASLISLGRPRFISKHERWYHILGQIGIPFLIAGLGMVGAGILLESVIEWEVFKEVSELTVLVTPLLGLKGNLEMTLAARLSTHANIGTMDLPGKKWKLCRGNLVLDQLQAIICGLAASLIAIGIGVGFEGNFHFDNACLVMASSILTASMVSIILGSTMITVILLSKRFHINPDNVATPVAGSLGDIITLGMLSCFASLLFRQLQVGNLWISFVIIGVYVSLLPIFIWITYRNEYTKPVLIAGWVPLVVSVCISTGGGIILDLAKARHPGVALYQPVINGIGGNLVSVQASRISTELHGECKKGILPNQGSVCESPLKVFFTKSVNSMSARLLLFLAIPGHLIFSTVTHFVTPSGDSQYGVVFLSVYITAAVCQVALLLYIAKILTNFCWRRGIDPDTATIPYLTALGDLFGSGFLLIAFEFLKTLNTIEPHQ